MAGKQSPDAPVGSGWLHGSGGGHGESPFNRARLLSPAVFHNATTVASLVTRRIPQMRDICNFVGESPREGTFCQGRLPSYTTDQAQRFTSHILVRDHDISCQWRTARTPSRGLSQASCRASIIFTWTAYDKVPRVNVQEGIRNWRVGTR